MGLLRIQLVLGWVLGRGGWGALPTMVDSSLLGDCRAPLPNTHPNKLESIPVCWVPTTFKEGMLKQPTISKENGMGRGALTRVVGFWNSILDVFWVDDSHYGG